MYNSGFVNLWYGSYYEGLVGDKPISKYKLITSGADEKVVGIHLIGTFFMFLNVMCGVSEMFHLAQITCLELKMNNK